MIKAAIEKITSLAVPNYQELDGKTYCDKKLFEIKPEPGPVPDDMMINTLSGIVDYIKNNLDDESGHVIHIIDYNHVKLYGGYDPEFCRRKQYVSALSTLTGFKFGIWHDHESFIISMLSFFRQGGGENDFEKLMKYLNDISVDKSISLKDDGITQQASVKTGVVFSSRQDVPNPVTLYPYETFPEVNGIKRSFVFRVRENSHSGIDCALFESGDTRWKLEYVQAVKDYFTENLIADSDTGEVLSIAIIA